MTVEQVISDYQASLKAFLMSRLKNPADAEDVLQEILTKTFQNLHSLKSEEKLKPWLFQIAQNAVMDHHRRARRGAAVRPDDLWYAAPDSAAEHAFEPCLEPFLAALPPEAGAALRAIELQGVSQKAYAAEHGISYSTLKSRVQASRRQLRAMFEDCCDIAFAEDGSILDYSRKPDGCKAC